MTIEAVEKNEKVRKKKDMQKTIDAAKFNVKLLVIGCCGVLSIHGVFNY